MSVIAKETEESLKEDHLLIIMDATGDTRLAWDASDRESVKNAEQTFDKMKKEGYTAYCTDRHGDRAQVMQKFDPNAERMIMHRQMAGG